MTQGDLYLKLLTTDDRAPSTVPESRIPITDYIQLVRKRSWQQSWNGKTRGLDKPHEVTGEIWSDAIGRSLEEYNAVYIPKMKEPIYIDRPIILRSGSRLIVHPETEIRLVPVTGGTCMLRNSKVVSSQDHPIEMVSDPNTNILIEGGIWSDQNNDGKGRGGAFDPERSMPGSSGAFLLHCLRGIRIRNVVFRDCSAFAIQIGNVTDFVVENITYDETADGVHVEGPAARGIIRHINGKTNDDIVALNAWDWENSSITYGPISDILVEDINMQPGYTWSEIRLLPGTKIFPGGEKLACDIDRCLFRHIRGIHTFKIYDQPNISKPESDFADPIGRISDLFFSDIVVDGIRKADYYDKSADSVFDICVDIDGISVSDVSFNYIPGEGDMAPFLVSVGPKALTWSKKAITDGAENEWFEVFNPNANPVVAGLIVKDIQLPDPNNSGSYVPCSDPLSLINVRHLKLNPDFPKTMPRGGTGRGRIVDLSESQTVGLSERRRHHELK